MAIPDFDFILFGGTGDLAWRKLLPALFSAHCADLLPPGSRILATGSRNITCDDYLHSLDRNVYATLPAASSEAWTKFLSRISYMQVDAEQPDHFDALARAVFERRPKVIVCYLATAPHLFVPICEQLKRAGINTSNVRLVLEKPLGHDLASNEAINAAIGDFFAEDQIYRIDHYLGKESVQNLMAIRFGNALFEPLWRREWVRDVQITIAEELGIESRGNFYDRTGALRDMVQNHLLQLLCMVAMEPPAALSEDAIRDEKIKILKALKPIASSKVFENTVRGQYRAGAIGGKPVRGFLEEDGIAPGSHTETFVAIKAEIANWRWEGVPFYLRTGKRMESRVAEIVVNFRDIPHAIFPTPSDLQLPNRLVIRLQPDESIRLHFLVKQPGDTLSLTQRSLDLDISDSFSEMHRADAYERLLLDVIRGRLGLFVRRDEQVQAWRWIEPIIEAWKQSSSPPKSYIAGTWGPAESSSLMSRANSTWHEENQAHRI